jgi:DNA-binding transcriptional regulator YiaG
MKKMNIKELRTKSGMTQKQFSEYLNIPKRTIEEWEGQRRIPPIYVLELIEYKLKKEGKV